VQELKPSDESAGTVVDKIGFHQNEVDRPLVLVAGTPSVISATGFQDRVAKAAKNQGPCYEGGCVIFDEKNGLHRPSVKFSVGLR
jgi:hypothetical protein